MSNIEPYAGRRLSPAQHRKQHLGRLAQMDRSTELAEAQIDRIGAVTDRAIVRAQMNRRMAQTAADLDPEGTALYDYLSQAGAMQMAEVIRRTGRA